MNLKQGNKTEKTAIFRKIAAKYIYTIYQTNTYAVSAVGLY